MTLKRRLLALLSSLLFATSVFAAPSISGPHVTMQTDGSLSTGQANIITNNAGRIQFFTNKTLCGYFDGSTCALTGVSLGTVTLASPTISGDATFSSAAASIIGGATSISIGSAGSTIIKGRNDANRLFTFDAATDTALTFKFGDGTAAQSLSILGSTADAADTQSFQYGVATTISPTRGAYGQLFGNEYGGGVSGAYYLSTGDTAGADMFLMAKDDIRFQTEGGTEAGSWDMPTKALTIGGDAILSAATTATLRTASVDATDNITLVLSSTSCASGDCTSRGGTLQLYGNEVASVGGGIVAQLGGTTGNFRVLGESGAINIFDVEDSDNSATFAGKIFSTATSDIGWTLQSAANQACNTTCTSACIVGQETTSKALLTCTDATADVCLCAGAS